MIKKIIFLLILGLTLVSCTGETTGLTTTEDPIDQGTKPVIDLSNTDANLEVMITSAPPETDAPTTVEIQYRADQTDDLASDFLYFYELKIGNEVEATGEKVTETKVKFAELKTSTQYNFVVTAYNKKTGKASAASDIVLFKTSAEEISNPFEENIVFTVSLDKTTVKPGEDLTVTFNLRNKADQGYDFIPSTNLDTRDKWQLTDDQSPNRIEAGEIISFTRTYNLKEYESLLILTFDIEDLDSGFKVSAAAKTIDIPDTEDASVQLKKVEIRSSAAEIFPGERGVRIYYTVKNNVNDSVNIKSIEARFYDLAGNDLTEYFTDTTTDTKTLSAKAEVSVYHIYNVGDVPPGNIYVDATATIDYEGDEFSDNTADEIGKIKVVNKGTGVLTAWVAYPEGALDGVVSIGQEFTIYAKVNYSGNADYNLDGEVSLDKDALDGMRITSGSETTTFNLNEQVQWTVRAGTIPITGNLRIFIKTAPNDSSEDLDLEFDTDEVLLNIQTVEEAELDIETGIETDEYGAKDGIIKAGTELTVYATLLNVTDTAAVGNVRMQLNEGTMGNFKLASGETMVKEVAVGTKATWTLKAPLEDEVNHIEIEFLSMPEDPNSNEELSVTLNSSNDIRVEAVEAADIQLKNVTVLQEQAVPGEDSIPIVFDIQNTGGVTVKVEEIKANFTQKGVDVSDKWILSETSVTNSSTIEPGTTRSVTAYYRLSENIYDGSDLVGDVIVTGEVKVSDIVSEEIIEDLQPKVSDVVEVKDVVAPIAVAGADIAAALGDRITLDGSGSTDNVAITSWAWSIYNEKGISVLSTSLSGETVIYTIGSNFEAGVYTVELKVNDAAKNGTISDTLILTIQ